MKTIKDLLNDNIINKSELILKRHEYLGLDAAQAAFLSKIFVDNREDYTKLDINEIASLMSVDTNTAETIVRPLVTKGILGIVSNNGDTFFNLEQLVTKLLETYAMPMESSKKELKINWITKQIGFDLSNDNIIELERVIDTYDWTTILNVIEKFDEQSNKNFPLLISLITVAANSKEKKENQLKSVMDVNWLE